MPAKQYRKPARTYEDIRAEWVGTKQRPGHLVAAWWTWKARSFSGKLDVEPWDVIVCIHIASHAGAGRPPDDDDVIGGALKLLLDAAVVARIIEDDGPSRVRLQAKVKRGARQPFVQFEGYGTPLELPKPLPTLNELIDAAKFSGMRMAQRKAVRR